MHIVVQFENSSSERDWEGPDGQFDHEPLMNPCDKEDHLQSLIEDK